MNFREHDKIVKAWKSADLFMSRTTEPSFDKSSTACRNVRRKVCRARVRVLLRVHRRGPIRIPFNVGRMSTFGNEIVIRIVKKECSETKEKECRCRYTEKYKQTRDPFPTSVGVRVIRIPPICQNRI